MKKKKKRKEKENKKVCMISCCLPTFSLVKVGGSYTASMCDDMNLLECTSGPGLVKTNVFSVLVWTAAG